MPATRFHPSLLVLGLLLLLLPLLVGTTYKWRDPQGQINLTDTPPPSGVPYEIVPEPRWMAPAVPATTGLAPPDAAAPVPAPPASPADSAAVSFAEAEADRRCIEALYQIELLVGKYKVYKPGPGEDRTYLDDRDRPEEIARLQKVRDADCSSEAPLHGSQEWRAAQLFQALSADCREAREKLRLMQRPDSRTPDDDIDRHREWMSRYCPEVPDAESHADVWLADWVWQWHRR